uniref:Uncharacterized protein n=1 Tax=Setaria viridis TaxID=4556 RepID=A0A4U6TVC3_SETVI|nr:hypothetical protein SEVIR_7G184966v2 [Setaria viridis]
MSGAAASPCKELPSERFRRHGRQIEAAETRAIRTCGKRQYRADAAGTGPLLPAAPRAAVAEFVATGIFVFAAEGSVYGLCTPSSRTHIHTSKLYMNAPCLFKILALFIMPNFKFLSRARGFSLQLVLISSARLEDFLRCRILQGSCTRTRGRRAASGRGGNRARAGAGRRGGGGEQRVGRARQPGRHVRRARGPPHLFRARRRLLLGREAARRRGRRVPSHARLRRHAPRGLRARPGRPRAARAPARGRHDVRPRVRRVRYRGGPPEPRRLRPGGEHPRRRPVRRRGDEPGAGVRAGARRMELAPP